MAAASRSTRSTTTAEPIEAAAAPARTGKRRSASVPAPRHEPVAVVVPSGPFLTPGGRAALRDRAERLRTEKLETLRPLLMEWERDERFVAEFERVLAEHDEIHAVLAESADLSYDADTIDHVVPGARVVLEMPDGDTEAVRIVHPVEAFLDDERISASSPLAQALLGAGVGHTVWVAAPTGQWPCRVVEVSLDEQVRPRA